MNTIDQELDGIRACGELGSGSTDDWGLFLIDNLQDQGS